MSRLADRAVGALIQGIRRLAPDNDGPNPWLEGSFAPVYEEVEQTALPVTGAVPPELDGLYARIGPNPVHPPQHPGRYHWFSGDGMVHGVRLKDGRALWYRNRWVRTGPVSRALGEPPAPGPRRGVFETVNTNVIAHAGQIWALVEAGPFPVALNSRLETVAHTDLGGTLATAFSPHPHLDPHTGELHAVCYDARVQNHLFHVVVGRDGRVSRLLAIPVRHGPMVHDCALTERYVIVLDLPVTFSPRRLLRGVLMPYAWNPRHESRIGLLPRDDQATADDIQWCAVDPCYVFHTCNACDLPDGRVQLDVVAHDRMFDHSTIGPDSRRVTLERWLLDPRRGTTVRTVLDDRGQEFPRMDARRIARPYRFAYTTSYGQESADGSCLYKHDLETGRLEAHRHGPGRETGEAVFVPRHPDAAEDDGWLLSFVHDANRGASDLVILNAQDVSGPPQAVVHLSTRVPHGFHGNWIGATEVAMGA
ncbi:carotenoid oxygenase family protein [Pedomonas sp. V897]|uniref:carotenoid oxygenase family protein n=1 Tax=Pedomonas sp. V897 TaxID=3446482 RepID=UPI003EDF6DB5